MIIKIVQIISILAIASSIVLFGYVFLKAIPGERSEVNNGKRRNFAIPERLMNKNELLEARKLFSERKLTCENDVHEHNFKCYAYRTKQSELIAKLIEECLFYQ